MPSSTPKQARFMAACEACGKERWYSAKDKERGRITKLPSASPKQARFFAAVAHSPAFARKVGVPMKVGEDFNEADKGTGILKKPSNPGKAFSVKKTRSWTGM